MAESASSCSSPPPVFSPLPLNSRLSHRTFSYEYENGGSEAMQKDALKHVENIVYERYILDLKGMNVDCRQPISVLQYAIWHHFL